MKKFLILLGLLPMLTLSSSQQEFSEYLERKEMCESWKHLGSEEDEGLEIHHLELSPLEWPKKGGILKKAWEQKIMVFKPTHLQSKMALLVVGSDSSKAWDLEALKQLAIQTSSIVAILAPVPNQPFTTADGRELKEDDLMAYTWNQFLDKRRANALLLAPMCKSIKSALDTLQAWGKSTNTPIESFALAGKSKRAWASWLLAANDPRVDLLFSCSFNFLNFAETAKYQYEIIGSWPEALLSYIRAGFNETSIKNRAVSKLFSIVDPYAWKSKLKQHKYLITSASDPFFIANATQFYLKDLEGTNQLRFHPSADHNLSDVEVIGEMGRFLTRYSQRQPFPVVASELHGKRLKISFNEKPSKAVLWYSFAKNIQATHLDRSPKWESIQLPSVFQDSIEVQIPHQAHLVYEETSQSNDSFKLVDAKMDAKMIDQGVTAAFVELHFADGYVTTTEVAVVR